MLERDSERTNQDCQHRKLTKTHLCTTQLEKARWEIPEQRHKTIKMDLCDFVRVGMRKKKVHRKQRECGILGDVGVRVRWGFLGTKWTEMGRWGVGCVEVRWGGFMKRI